MGEHLNTAGLNGKGRAIEQVANHAILVLGSRLIGVIGVPIALAFFWGTLADFKQMQDGLTELKTEVRLMNERIEYSSSDRYSGADAARDLMLRDQRDDFLTERLASLGVRLQQIEREIGRNQ